MQVGKGQWCTDVNTEVALLTCTGIGLQKANLIMITVGLVCAYPQKNLVMCRNLGRGGIAGRNKLPQMSVADVE